jgi:glycosyltransferase involved in cell wall biosynthesis
MKELLERVSLVVLLSEFETNSLAALEALAAGCGLLVADRAGLKELAEDGLARAVDPGTRHEVIASAILDELDQPREPKVVPEMSWDECAARLLDLYRAVIRDAAGSGALARK